MPPTNDWTAELDGCQICVPVEFLRWPSAEPKQMRSKFAALVLSRWIAMLRRAILAFAALIALSQTATAGVALFGHVSCAVVRYYVAIYSEAAAETWARSHGASNAEIETARHCLHPANVQTANLATKSQVVASVTEEARAQTEPAERNSDQDARPAVPVQGQRAHSMQDNHDNEPVVHGLIRPKDVEDRSAEHVSHDTKDLVPSDGGKTNNLCWVEIGVAPDAP